MPRFSKSELIKLQKKLKTDAEIGKKFGMTRQAVHTMRKFSGILFRFTGAENRLSTAAE